jgi:hypothetical protein
MTNLTYLAMGYAHNLSITKLPLGMLHQMGKADAPDDARNAKVAEIMTKAHSLEEQRAYLGCYYVMSL